MNNPKKQLGVIGGLGPLATAWFMELVIRMTDARTDQQHLDMLIYNIPSIPDRTAYLLDPTKEDPLPAMIRVGKALAQQGAQCVAIPCVTAHHFLPQLSREIPIPIIDAVAETVDHLRAFRVSAAGILATDGTIATKLLQNALESQGIRAVLPDAADQQKVMDLIYQDIKADRPVNVEKFRQVSDHLRRQGAQVNILGCTELSLIKREHNIGPGYIDALEVLAQQSVLRCGGILKEKYRCLISKE